MRSRLSLLIAIELLSYPAGFAQQRSLNQKPALKISIGALAQVNSFEENIGQANSEAQFLFRGRRVSTLFRDGGEIVTYIFSNDLQSVSKTRLHFLGRTSPSHPEGELPASTLTYYVGDDPAQWFDQVPTWSVLRYREIYPGIDLVVRINCGSLEFDFELASGADPNDIRFRWEDAKEDLLDNGELSIGLTAGNFRQMRPRTFEASGPERSGKAGIIPSQYILNSEGVVSIRLGRYNSRLGIVIDPVLNFSYLGGGGFDAIYSVAAAFDNSLVATGETSSADFPSPGSAPTVRTTRKAFVTSFDKTSGTIVHTTFIGGNGNDAGHHVEVSKSGDIYIAGTTSSTNFPVTDGAWHTTVAANATHAFLTRLNAAGSVIYSLVLGGSANDSGASVAVDSNGAAYIVGQTSSMDFPATVGAFQVNNHGGVDCFITKVESFGESLLYSTLLGGNSGDVCSDVALTGADEAVVAGSTASSDFPFPGSDAASLAASRTAFAAKLNAAGSALVFSTRIGGTTVEEGNAVGVDATGSVFIGGSTGSTNFPVTAGAFQRSGASGYDAFVCKLDGTAGQITYCALIGGQGSDSATSIAVRTDGSVLVGGFTSSADFPLQSPEQSSYGGGFDAFAILLSPDGSHLVYSTLWGGIGDDRAYSARFAPDGAMLLAGMTSTPSLGPGSPGAQKLLAGQYDGMVLRLSAVVCSFSTSSVNPQSFAASGGTGIAIVNASSPGCFPVAGSNVNWMSVTMNNGASVSFSVAPNTGPVRSGILTIAGQPFTVTEDPGAGIASVVGVSPAAGIGSSAAFVATYSNTAGASAFSTVYLLIGTSTSVSGSCFAEYSPSNNAFSLFLDAGPPDAVPAQVGHDASNRQCTLSGSGLGATQSGNNLIVTFPVTFSGSYQGSKNIYLLTYDIQGRSGGWQKMGTWDVALFSTGPSVVSLTPTQGVGQNGTFIATFLHPGGASQHYLGYILFLPTPNVVQYTATGSCLVEYNRISNAMRLINDAGTNWLPGTMGIALNRGGSLTNSHCTLDVTHSSAHINGITMIVTVAVTFSASFTGQLATFMQAFDVTGAYSGMTQFGNWMGAPGTQKPGPYVVGVSPTSGAGTSTKMSFTAGHTKGLSALSFVTVLINSVIVGGVPCQIFYFLAANTLNLVNDGGTAMLSTTGIAPGTAGSLANSRCAIDAGGASRVISGNNVTVKLPLTFNAETLGGAQNVYVNAFDNVGMLSHWVLGGSWSVQ